MTGVSDLLTNNGLTPNQPSQPEDSPRWRGVKQGIMIWLVGFFLVALLVALVPRPGDFYRVFVAALFVLGFFGGLLRMAYALMFQSKSPKNKFPEQQFLAENQSKQAFLPPQQTIPVADFVAPGRRTTNDLMQPYSVVETTTKLLEKEER